MKDRIIFIHAASDCIKSIEDYTQDYNLEKFLNDKKTQDAVIRNLEVLGQTIKDFGIDELKKNHPDIPWSQVAGMRNIIAHEYLGLDSQLIWETITHHLSPLKSVFASILNNKHT